MPNADSSTPDKKNPDTRQEHLKMLVHDVEANPGKQIPLMKLAHFYIQSWIKSDSEEMLDRAMQCLEKAIEMETGEHTAQLKQLFFGIKHHAEATNHLMAQARLDALSEKLNDRLNKVNTPIKKPRVEIQALVIDDTDLPLPRTPSPALSEEKSESEEPARDNPTTTTPTEPDDLHSAEEHKQQSGVEILAEVDALFEENDITGVLQTYAHQPVIAIKRKIIEKMAHRIDEIGIEPLLALGAMDDQEVLHRQIMRLLVKMDRTHVASMIDFENYSTDLRRMAVIVLSELATQSAMKKLATALEVDDVVIRCAALRGLAGAGEIAEEYIATFVNTAKGDPSTEVRHEAAKALRKVNTKEAFEAFDKQAMKTHFDPAILVELERMRDKFDPNGVILGKRVAKLEKELEDAGKTEPTEALRSARHHLANRRERLTGLKKIVGGDRRKLIALQLTIAIVLLGLMGFCIVKQTRPVMKMMRTAYPTLFSHQRPSPPAKPTPPPRATRRIPFGFGLPTRE